MSRNARIVLGLVVLGLVAAGAGALYIWVSGGSGEVSATLAAPTLPARTPQSSAETEAASASDDPVAVAEGTETAADGQAAPDGEGVLFEIVPDESEARFSIFEELRGEPNTVIGRTNQVAGQIFVDFSNPAQSQVGMVRVNVRNLATDNEFRNRAIRGQILQVNNSPDFEYADFTPTTIADMPDAITIGEPVTFRLSGDLRVRDITNPVTFEVTVTSVSETRLEGLASAVVTRSDYALTIPNVPGVANVGEEVTLEIEFVAQAVDGI